MTRSVSRVRVAIAVVAIMLAAAAGPLHPAPLAAQTSGCGVLRWPVKVLLDDDAASVDLTPRTTTVAALVALPRPTESRPPRARLPLERWTFRVRAIVTFPASDEADGDKHLLLADPADPRLTLIAEIPDSACAVGSRHASDYAEARRVVERLREGAEVEVEGVAFWDSDHGQVGMAPNGIELHPVLRVVEVLPPAAIGALTAGGLAALRAPADTSGVRVWLNTSSRIYHCPGSANYGRTTRGEYMPESVAVARGARPAGGRPCR